MCLLGAWRVPGYHSQTHTRGHSLDSIVGLEKQANRWLLRDMLFASRSVAVIAGLCSPQTRTQ